MRRMSKYSQAVGYCIDMVRSKTSLPTEAEYGQLCLVDDDKRSYVYEGNEWIILPEFVQDDRVSVSLVVAALRLKNESKKMISKESALRMEKELDEAKLRKRAQKTFFETGLAPTDEAPPDTAPETPGRHMTYWIDRQYVCTYCGQPKKHRIGWVFLGNNPQGDTVFFCNVDCCNKWEADLDNMNDRRGAIKATRRKRAEREEHG